VPEALVIVDFQNDFTPGGALAVPEGDAIADRINELAASGSFDLVIATRDWHPPDHGSFEQNGGPWPSHCVQGSEGAELHPALERAPIAEVIDKGQDPSTEGYSGFEGTRLGELLRERGIDTVTVVGLATDYCVKNTALDALREGFDVKVDLDAVRGVDVTAGDSERALDELRGAGAHVTRRLFARHEGLSEAPNAPRT
jgi:nicotinamidase/pyrazinamidase